MLIFYHNLHGPGGAYPQQISNPDQSFPADRRCGRSPHRAARRSVKHPLGDFLGSGVLILLQAAPERCEAVSHNGPVDEHRPPVPRMPGIVNRPGLGIMGVELSSCTTKFAFTVRSAM